MAASQPPDRRESNRRYATVAAAFVLVLLLVVFGSLFYACDETAPPVDTDPQEEILPVPTAVPTVG